MTSAWIELQGTANTRDLGGLPTASGKTAHGVLIRSDNLQDLSAADVRALREDRNVTLVIDLRTPGEAEVEGPTPLQADGVDYVLLSFVPDLRSESDAGATPDIDRILPDRAGQDRTAVYLNYLSDQPDEVVEAVRRIARASGGTVIHCAAGKDRTGTLAALVLDAVGTEREAVIEDYVATGEVIEAVVNRLSSRPVYATGMTGVTLHDHTPQADTLRQVLVTLDSEWGGAAGWLIAHGLTSEELALLRSRLLS